MSTQTTNQSNNLQTILSQAVQAYELARTTRLQAERQAQDELRKSLDARQKQQRMQTQQVETEHKREYAVAAGEQKRLKDILTATEQIRIAAGSFLEKAGLAHIAGMTLRLDETDTPVQRQNETAAKEFAEAQLAYVDLRTALLQLAMAYTDAEQWEQARQVIQPLLDNKKAPLYTEALNALCDTYYRPGVAALAAEDWATARQNFEAILQIDPIYRDTPVLLREIILQNAKQALEAGNVEEARGYAKTWLATNKNDAQFTKLLRETYLRPARQALKANSLDEARLHTARSHIEAWLRKHQDDVETRDLLCETYYQPALAALAAEQWLEARTILKQIAALNQQYKEVQALVRETYLYPAKQALGASHFDAVKLQEAILHAKAWIEDHRNDTEAHNLLCEIHYTLIKMYMQHQWWRLAGEQLKALQALNPLYREIPQLLASNSSLAWMSGAIELVRDLSSDHAQAFTFLPNGQLLISSKYPEEASWWEITTGQLVHKQHISDSDTVTLSSALSSKGQLLASGHGSGVGLWEIATGRPVSILKGKGLKGNITSIAFSSDGRWLAAGSGGPSLLPEDGRMGLWEIATGHLVSILKIHGTFPIVAFSHDGQLLAVGGDDEVTLWQITTGKLVSTLKRSSLSSSIAFSLDGGLLAVGGGDEVILWRIATGELLSTFRTEQSMVDSIAFSPDGQLLACGGYNGTVQLWEVSTGQRIHTLSVYEDNKSVYEDNNRVSTLAFSPDGRLLASGGWGNTKIWKPMI